MDLLKIIMETLEREPLLYYKYGQTSITQKQSQKTSQ